MAMPIPNFPTFFIRIWLWISHTPDLWAQASRRPCPGCNSRLCSLNGSATPSAVPRTHFTLPPDPEKEGLCHRRRIPRRGVTYSPAVCPGPCGPGHRCLIALYMSLVPGSLPGYVNALTPDTFLYRKRRARGRWKVGHVEAVNDDLHRS